MQVNTADLIDLVVWLLNRMDRGQVLRVLSFANRLFVSDGRICRLQPASAGLEDVRQENPHPGKEGPQNA